MLPAHLDLINQSLAMSPSGRGGHKPPPAASIPPTLFLFVGVVKDAYSVSLTTTLITNFFIIYRML